MTEPASQAAPAFAGWPGLLAPAGRAVLNEDLNRELAGIAFPEFWFGRLTHRRLPSRWVAVCRDDATAGLYTVVTADLNVLTAALTLDSAWRAGHGQPGTQR